MAGKDDKRPIIIKKIKKGGHGHHGGAWKVAYADFVTAMMAFFLLLWLLSTSSKSKLQGIAEYFTPTVGLKDGQGIGFKGGTSQSTEGQSKSNMAQPGVVTGATPSGPIADNPESQSPVEADQDDKMFKKGSTEITQALNEDTAMQPFKDQVTVQQTPEGLRIDISDSDKHPMYQQSSATLTEDGKVVLDRMSKIIHKMPNYLAITGHTDASPEETGKADYTSWELSADRANAARRFLLKSGIDPQQPKRAVGMADKELLLPKDPRNPRNRRITLLMMRGSHILIPDAAVPEKAGDAVAPAPAVAPATPGAAPAATPEKK